MYTSDRFQKDFRRLQKDENPDQLEARLEQRFLHYLPGLPKELGQELFAHCYSRWEANAGDLIFGDLLDLMHMQYDEQNDPLDDEDWEAVREIVSSFAVDLDMHLVTYVMQLVVERGQV